MYVPFKCFANAVHNRLTVWPHTKLVVGSIGTGGATLGVSRCGREACTSAKKPTSRCSRCKAIAYCGRPCQKSDWDAHQMACRPQTLLAPPTSLAAPKPRPGVSTAATTAMAAIEGMSFEEIKTAVEAGTIDPEQLCREMVAEATARGDSDPLIAKVAGVIGRADDVSRDTFADVKNPRSRIRWEFGGPTRSRLEQFRGLTGDGNVFAHAWLEDGRGRVYDSLMHLPSLARQHGLAIVGHDDQVITGVDKAVLKARGIHYVAAPLDVQGGVFRAWQASAPAVFPPSALAAASAMAAQVAACEPR